MNDALFQMYVSLHVSLVVRIIILCVTSYCAVRLQRHSAISLLLAQLQQAVKVCAFKHRHAPGRAIKAFQ